MFRNLLTTAATAMFALSFASHAHSQSENLDASELLPINVDAKVLCFHPESFHKHIFEARKLWILSGKVTPNDEKHLVLTNDHGEIYMVIMNKVLGNGLVGDCIFASIGPDINGSPVLSERPLVNKGPLAPTGGPSGGTKSDKDSL